MKLKNYTSAVSPERSVSSIEKILVVAYGDWPTRSVRHRGWGLPITSRLMVEDEIEYEKTCARYHFYRYEKVESLLADEQKIVTEDVCNKLKECFAKLFEIDLNKIKPKPIQRRLFAY